MRRWRRSRPSARSSSSTGRRLASSAALTISRQRLHTMIEDSGWGGTGSTWSGGMQCSIEGLTHLGYRIFFARNMNWNFSILHSVLYILSYICCRIYFRPKNVDKIYVDQLHNLWHKTRWEYFKHFLSHPTFHWM